MPNPIPPNLDPARFGYLDPLVFGEYNAAGNIGWGTAINNILAYYQGQAPFQDAILDFSELGQDILEAWKENLAQELADNSATELAELVLQTLILVTGEQVEGVEPLIPPEEPEPLPDVEPEEPTPEPEPTREPFPPVVVPREPGTSPERRDQPEPPEPPEPPIVPDRPARPSPPIRQPAPRVIVPPVPLPPVLPLPRQPVPQEPRPPVPESPEQPSPESPVREPLEEPVSVEGTGDPESPPINVSIDYGALENAIYNALRRFYDLVLGNPFDAFVDFRANFPMSPEDMAIEIEKQRMAITTYHDAQNPIDVNTISAGTSGKYDIPGEN